MADTVTESNAKATAMNTFRSVGIVVSDIDRSIAFYRGVVGMQERRRVDVSAMHLLGVVMGFGAEGGGAALVLMHYSDETHRSGFIKDPTATQSRSSKPPQAETRTLRPVHLPSLVSAASPEPALRRLRRGHAPYCTPISGTRRPTSRLAPDSAGRSVAT